MNDVPERGEIYEAGGYTYRFNGFDWVVIDSIYGDAEEADIRNQYYERGWATKRRRENGQFA